MYVIVWKIERGSCVTTPSGTTCVQDMTPVPETTATATPPVMEPVVEPVTEPVSIPPVETPVEKPVEPAVAMPPQ